MLAPKSPSLTSNRVSPKHDVIVLERAYRFRERRVLLIVRQQNNTCKTGSVYRTHAPRNVYGNNITEDSEREGSRVKDFVVFLSE